MVEVLKQSDGLGSYVYRVLVIIYKYSSFPISNKS